MPYHRNIVSCCFCRRREVQEHGVNTISIEVSSTEVSYLIYYNFTESTM